MRVLVTGASGMLAVEVVPQLIANGYEVVQTDHRLRKEEIIRLDITDGNRVSSEVAKIQPNCIFHLAAETNVDLCEEKPEHAFKVNTLGTENIVSACQKFNLSLVFISTAAVFDGKKKEPYVESDTPNPINVYAKSKWQAELVVQKFLKEYFIVRASWMVGGWKIDKKFVYQIVRQVLEGKREIRVVSDKSGSPTFTRDFAKNLIKLFRTGRYGLYHMANKGTATRYEIAVKIVDFMGAKDKVKVIPIHSDEFPMPAPRPDSEKIRNCNLDLLGLNEMPPWEESLKEYILTNKDKKPESSSISGK